MGLDPLIHHPIFGSWADQCIGRFGLKVCDYRNGGEWHNLVEISQDLLPLMTSLNATFTNLDRDTLIWGETKDALYSIAIGYLSLLGRVESPLWAKA